MRLKALDTIRIASATPKGRQEQGDEFTINKEEGEDLVRRGLAEEVKPAKKPAKKSAKKASPSNNKARSGAPKNKGA